MIAGSGPYVESPSYKFVMFPVELLLLPFRLETQQDLLVLPNGIFSHIGQQFGQTTAKNDLGGDESSISFLKTPSKIWVGLVV